MLRSPPETPPVALRCSASHPWRLPGRRNYRTPAVVVPQKIIATPQFPPESAGQRRHLRDRRHPQYFRGPWQMQLTHTPPPGSYQKTRQHRVNPVHKLGYARTALNACCIIQLYTDKEREQMSHELGRSRCPFSLLPPTNREVVLEVFVCTSEQAMPAQRSKRRAEKTSEASFDIER
jgi:hypothetical protein